MTRHSTLTNSDDLHYAKVRSFTGNPAIITPDFVDQLLAATDTNKIYRATGTLSGNLVELVPTDGGGGGVISVGNTPPQSPPAQTGELFFDEFSRVLYCSNLVNVWVPTIPPVEISFFEINETDVINTSPNASGYFSIFYSNTFSDPPSGQTIILENLQDIGIVSSDSQLEEAINSYGAGVYGFGYTLDDPDGLINSYSINTNVFDQQGFNLDSIHVLESNQVSHLGKECYGGLIYISRHRRTYAKFSLALGISVI